MSKVPHRLMCLNAWLPAGGAVLGYGAPWRKGLTGGSENRSLGSRPAWLLFPDLPWLIWLLPPVCKSFLLHLISRPRVEPAVVYGRAGQAHSALAPDAGGNTCRLSWWRQQWVHLHSPLCAKAQSTFIYSGWGFYYTGCDKKPDAFPPFVQIIKSFLSSY